MIPALSSSSEERSVYTALGTFTGSIGYNGVTAIVVPVVAFFGSVAGAGAESQAGWSGFGAVVGILGIITCLAVAFGTREEESVLRDPGDKSSPLQAFQAIGRNDQLAVGVPVLRPVLNRERRDHRLHDLPLQVRAAPARQLLRRRHHRLRHRPGCDAPVPGDQPSRAAPLPLPRWHGAHGYRLHLVHPLLHKPHDRFIALVLFYLPATCIPDDRDPDNHGLCRVRPAQDRQAQRSRRPIGATHAGQDRRCSLELHRPDSSPSRPP